MLKCTKYKLSTIQKKFTNLKPSKIHQKYSKMCMDKYCWWWVLWYIWINTSHSQLQKGVSTLRLCWYGGSTLQTSLSWAFTLRISCCCVSLTSSAARDISSTWSPTTCICTTTTSSQRIVI